MTDEQKEVSFHIDALMRLEREVSRTISCQHSLEMCRLQSEALKARPAINAALALLREKRMRLKQQQ